MKIAKRIILQEADDAKKLVDTAIKEIKQVIKNMTSSKAPNIVGDRIFFDLKNTISNKEASAIIKEASKLSSLKPLLKSMGKGEKILDPSLEIRFGSLLGSNFIFKAINGADGKVFRFVISYKSGESNGDDGSEALSKNDALHILKKKYPSKVFVFSDYDMNDNALFVEKGQSDTTEYWVEPDGTVVKE